ncbi:IS66 family insertion sequence element accessory protein TnpB [Succinimonas amylolytica]|uniref:IS66 family insertion sequence element accessory protein TnpB n=1 Tax=Succinimonas amylolytica TaxID=83769 RepID=UPI0012F85AC8
MSHQKYIRFTRSLSGIQVADSLTFSDSPSFCSLPGLRKNFFRIRSKVSTLDLIQRFEDGSLKWPKDADEAREITSRQLRWLLNGLTIDPKHYTKELDTLNL